MAFSSTAKKPMLRFRPYGESLPEVKPASALTRLLTVAACGCLLGFAVRLVGMGLSRAFVVSLPAAVQDPLIYMPTAMWTVIGFCLVVLSAPRWRRVLFGILVALGLGSAALESGPVWGTPTLANGNGYRLLTYNIHFYAEPDEKLADFILEQDADIVLLQEVPQWWFTKHQARLQERYPGLIYTATLALATASKFPFASAAWQDTMANGWRGVLSIDVQTPDGILTVSNAHLVTPSPIPWRLPGRLQEQWDNAPYLVEIVSEPAGPMILGGDYNFPRWCWTHTKLRQEIADLTEAVPPGLSYSFPSRVPMLRIDQIIGRQVQFGDTQVISTTLSDHRPMVTRFAIKPTPPTPDTAHSTNDRGT